MDGLHCVIVLLFLSLSASLQDWLCQRCYLVWQWQKPLITREFANSSHVCRFNWSYVGQSIRLHIKQTPEGNSSFLPPSMHPCLSSACEYLCPLLFSIYSLSTFIHDPWWNTSAWGGRVLCSNLTVDVSVSVQANTTLSSDYTWRDSLRLLSRSSWQDVRRLIHHLPSTLPSSPSIVTINTASCFSIINAARRPNLP